MNTPLLAGLLAAHMVADYPLQTDWMAENKHENASALYSHALVHGGVAVLLLAAFGIAPSTALLVSFIVAAIHASVDNLELDIRWDQTAHLSTAAVLWVVLS